MEDGDRGEDSHLGLVALGHQDLDVLAVTTINGRGSEREGVCVCEKERKEREREREREKPEYKEIKTDSIANTPDPKR